MNISGVEFERFISEYGHAPETRLQSDDTVWCKKCECVLSQGKVVMPPGEMPCVPCLDPYLDSESL